MAELQRAANSSALQEKLAQMRLLAERRQTGAKPTGIAYPDGNKPSVSASELESHGIYKRFWTTTAGNMEKRGIPANRRNQWEIVKDYIEHMDDHIRTGTGLMLIGSVGTGKTTMAIAVLRELVERRGVGYFIPMVSLLDLINSKVDSQSIIERVKTTPLLVLDDLGAEYDHAWVQAKVDAIITERYNRMRATIVTSNLKPTEIKDRYQMRIFDRLKATNKLIIFSGTSMRPVQE